MTRRTTWKGTEHRLAVEVTHRRSLAAGIVKSVGQAKAAAREKRAPVTLVHRHGGRRLGVGAHGEGGDNGSRGNAGSQDATR